MINFNFINKSNIHLLRSFLSLLNSDPASSTFRYFTNRNCPSSLSIITDNFLLSIIFPHVFTIVLTMDKESSKNKIIGYSHIDYDKEKNIFWFGLCILSEYQNKGYGSILIDYIISRIKEMNFNYIGISGTRDSFNKIYLSVDSTNLNAIRLYKKKGFTTESVSKTFSVKNNIIIMSLNCF
jgi:ribosomal protein S18 acetylase RimI-like enzyme